HGLLSPFEWWCRNFILPDICKPCLFVFLRNLFYLTGPGVFVSSAIQQIPPFRGMRKGQTNRLGLRGYMKTPPIVSIGRRLSHNKLYFYS
ncbi:hypothetical protein, partial [Flavonifractor plautii]|uniref:hypothetical protein n=1 Tax=Flavonifractor plautii TaxID=292800 RepID=UPI001A9A763B